jgi:hypothetical protein
MGNPPDWAASLARKAAVLDWPTFSAIPRKPTPREQQQDHDERGGLERQREESFESLIFKGVTRSRPAGLGGAVRAHDQMIFLFCTFVVLSTLS